MRSAFLRVAAAAGLAVPTPASAAPAPVTVHVSYKDLNIATPGGLAQLKKRVKVAVSRACAEAVGTTLNAYNADATCRAETQRRADDEIERHRDRSLAMLEARPG